MKQHIITIYILCLAVFVVGCKKSEDTVVPSNIVNTYSVPQGTSAYDNTIVGYYQKYGTYLLYKFSEKDAYWTPTSYNKPTASAAGFWSAGAEVAQADPAYVAAQLALIQSKWFNYYSDKFLKKFLPTKVLLCSKVDSISNGFVFGGPTIVYVKQAKKISAFYNYDNIQVNFGDATVTTMTAAEQRIFLAKINQIFIQSIIARGLTQPTTEFINSADYVTAMTTSTQGYGKGILVPYYSVSAQADWNAYITAMVTYSSVNLNASTAIGDLTPVGILNATKDVNGQLKKRYAMVRNYFINEYGVDLQLVGNAAKGI